MTNVSRPIVLQLRPSRADANDTSESLRLNQETCDWQITGNKTSSPHRARPKDLNLSLGVRRPTTPRDSRPSRQFANSATNSFGTPKTYSQNSGASETKQQCNCNKSSKCKQNCKNSIEKSVSISSASPSSASSATSTTGTSDSDSSPSLILPYLYVGDQAQTKIDTISNLNISYILSLQSLPKFLDKPDDVNPPVEQAVEVDSDGEILPSVNSSRDYLVKIKSKSDIPHGIDELEEKVETKKSRQVTIGGDQICKDLNITSEPKLECQNDEHKHEKNIKNKYNQSSEFAFGIQATGSKSDLCDTKIGSENSKLDDNIGKQRGHCSSAAIIGKCNRLSSSVQRLIRGKCINISDTFEQLLDKFFDETHNFIEEARRNKCNILVHCKAGISRSPTIAIAYLMKWKRLHLRDAYNFVKQCRPQISPNLNFMGQLVSYERQLRHCKSQLPSPTSCCLPSPVSVDNLSASEEESIYRRDRIYIAA